MCGKGQNQLNPNKNKHLYDTVSITPSSILNTTETINTGGFPRRRSQLKQQERLQM